MRLRKERHLALRSLATAAAVAGASGVLLAAAAQFWVIATIAIRSQPLPISNRSSRRRRGISFLFRSTTANRLHAAAAVVDYSKAPPRKIGDAADQHVVVIGDSLADWLAYGLDETYTDQPDIASSAKYAATSGIIRYDAKNDTLDWPQRSKTHSHEKPNAIVVMLGFNDRIPLARQVAAPKFRAAENGRAAGSGRRSSGSGPAATSSRRLPPIRKRRCQTTPRPRRSVRRRAALTSFIPSMGGGLWQNRIDENDRGAQGEGRAGAVGSGYPRCAAPSRPAT